MDFHLNHRQFNERQLLVERANRLIEKYDLHVPRFFSTRFINFEFWANVFIRIFGIKCNISLRTPSERVEAIKACLNTLACLIGENLDHIQADGLLNFDVVAMKNLIQIAELFDESIEVEEYKTEDENLNPEILPYSHKLRIPFDAEDKYSNKSQELANQLYKALKNQTLAMEIEKKIKIYFGDVTASQSNYSKMRSSRQSIVRTRAIQPSTSTFDYNFQKGSKRNQILSTELEKLFPEISDQLIEKIREQEKALIMSQRNIRIWQENLAMNQIMRSLNGAINQQRQRIDLLHKEVKEEDVISKKKDHRARQIAQKVSSRQVRSQKAFLQKDIDNFYNESTAAYLNARSHLERILMIEFSKVDANKRQQINEIRKYLRNHYETETENLRSLLENFDSLMFDN